MKDILKVILCVGILVFAGSIHYHYGNEEHRSSYHTKEGIQKLLLKARDNVNPRRTTD